VNFAPTSLRIQGAQSPLNTSTTAANTIVEVCFGLLDAAGTPQSGAIVRGGINLAANVTSSNTAVGVMVNGNNSIAGGQQCTTTIVATAIAFDPISAGTTTMTVAQPAGMMVATSNAGFAPTRVVDVSAPSFTPQGALTLGLNATQDANFNLDTPAPAGGLAVTITSSDPTRVLVVPGSNPNVLGTATTTINVAAGQTFVSYSAQGLANSGNATVTYSAPGYASFTRTVTFAPTSLRIQGAQSPLNTSTTAANTIVEVCFGLLDAAGTPQGGAIVRGGINLAANVTSSNTAVGVMVNGNNSIVGGQQCTTTTVATAIAFDPISAGTTTMTVEQPAGMIVPTSNPGFFPTRVVNVSAPSFNPQGGAFALGFNATQDASFSLDTPAPAGGLAVTITSSDPTRVLVVPGSNPNVLGTATTTINVPAGQTNVIYSTQGLQDNGSVTLTYSAPGHTSVTRAVSLAKTGVRLGSGSAPLDTTVGAANTVITVCLSLLNDAGTPQSGTTLRGGFNLPITVTSSNTAVGVMVNGANGIPGGQSCSTTTAATAIAFDPISAGTTTISVAQPAGMIEATSNTGFASSRVATVN
jgi:hypothetical protein